MAETYRDRIVWALLDGNNDEAERLMTAALDGISGQLQTIVSSTPQPDHFLLVPMLRSAADQLESVMTPQQKSLAAKLRERIVGITYLTEDEHGNDAGADRV